MRLIGWPDLDSALATSWPYYFDTTSFAKLSAAFTSAEPQHPGLHFPESIESY